MASITIKWLFDENDCDLCGPSYAEGAEVTFDDGREPMLLKPRAHCFDGCTWSEREVFTEILRALGHTVEEVE